MRWDSSFDLQFINSCLMISTKGEMVYQLTVSDGIHTDFHRAYVVPSLNWIFDQGWMKKMDIFIVKSHDISVFRGIPYLKIMAIESAKLVNGYLSCEKIHQNPHLERHRI